MLETGYRAPMSPRAAAALLRARRAEIVAGVVRQAAAGNRAAMRLASKHGLSVEPTPEVLAARMAESIERTRATVAMLIAEGGIEGGKDSRSAPAHPAGAQVIALSDVKTRRGPGASRRDAPNEGPSL